MFRPVLFVVASLSLPALLQLSAQAEGVRFGFTGVHALDEDIWSDMNDEGRVLFLEDRMGLAKRMGATVIRLGATAPRLVDMERIHAGIERNWTDADAAVGALKASGLELCLTLPELVSLEDMSEYQAYVTRLAERYDGDTDFGIDPADVNYEFPDIDGSGALTVADWTASDEVVAEWAATHRVEHIESGYEPRTLEMTGQLPEGVYAQQLKVAKASVNGAESDQELALAGVLLDGQSKSHFTNRFDSLDTSTAPWFDLAVAHVFESTADISQIESATHIAKFANWLDSVDHGDVPRWLGELAVPSVSGAGSDSPFTDERTSERTQSNGLIRLTVEAILEGYEAVLYAQPLEIDAAGGADERTGTGLVVVTEIPGLEPTQWPIAARPAYAVWRWLLGRFDAIDPADVSKLAGLPVNAKGVRVSGQGWLLWFDWTMEVSPGAEYADGQKPVTINGITTPSVKVTTLWPEEAGDKLDDEGAVEATWTETFVDVEGGSATIFVGRDPVWVETSEEILDEADVSTVDGGSKDASSTDLGTSAESDSGPSAGGGGGDGGCATSGAPISLVWFTLACLPFVRHRQRRSHGTAGF